MTTMSPEQYASRVEAVLVQELRRRGRRQVGSMPTPEEAVHLILDTEAAPEGNPLARQVGPVWSSAYTRQVLGPITRQALSSRRANGTILAVTTHEGSVYYPVFQFRRRGESAEVHPHLVPVLKILKGIDPWTVAAMLLATDPDLGTSAVDRATRGRDQHELEEWARTVRRELTAR